MSIDRLERKNGSVWRARVVLPNGKRPSRCFGRKVDAEQWVARLTVEGQGSSELKRHTTRFHDLARLFLVHGRGEMAVSTYQKYDAALRLHLIPEFGDFWVDEISKVHVVEFKTRLLQIDRSDSIKCFTFSTLKTLLRRAVEWDLLARNPAEGVRPPKKGMPRTEYWSESEINQFLSAMRSSARLPLYLLALNTGMRAGEIFGLKWDCVDLEHGLLTVRRTFDQKTGALKETTKTHRSRQVGINEVLHARLGQMRAQSSSEFVIQRREAGCWDTSHLAREFASDCARAEVRTIRFHDLRHTFATQFVGRGGSIHALAGILGHSTTAMSSRYAHYGPDHAKRAAKVMAFDVPLLDPVVSLDAHRVCLSG